MPVVSRKLYRQAKIWILGYSCWTRLLWELWRHSLDVGYLLPSGGLVGGTTETLLLLITGLLVVQPRSIGVVISEAKATE